MALYMLIRLFKAPADASIETVLLRRPGPKEMQIPRIS